METVLITGANRGIGLALAEALLQDGYAVIAGCRLPEAAADLQRLASRTRLIDIVLLDVNSDELVSAAVASVRKTRNRLDVIVNNAGLMPEKGDESIADLPLAHLRSALCSVSRAKRQIGHLRLVGAVPGWAGQPAKRSFWEAVRELRQRKAYYRCCIPALAGFVSLRSIAPDGTIPLDQTGG
jgi:NAD(P)-dependent dehydrogenase (short-subunit alcohol dehydrogenase family)